MYYIPYVCGSWVYVSACAYKLDNVIWIAKTYANTVNRSRYSITVKNDTHRGREGRKKLKQKHTFDPFLTLYTTELALSTPNVFMSVLDLSQTVVRVPTMWFAKSRRRRWRRGRRSITSFYHVINKIYYSFFFRNVNVDKFVVAVILSVDCIYTIRIELNWH